MPKVEEIRTEWKGIRSALGNLICYIDGKTEQLVDIENSWQKGYEFGLEAGWAMATRIVAMDVHERAKAFFQNAEAVTAEEPFKFYTVHEAEYMLKKYDTKKEDEDNLNFMRFLYNVIQPNEMESYRKMYEAKGETECEP